MTGVSVVVDLARPVLTAERASTVDEGDLEDRYHQPLHDICRLDVSVVELPVLCRASCDFSLCLLSLRSHTFSLRPNVVHRAAYSSPFARADSPMIRRSPTAGVLNGPILTPETKKSHSTSQRSSRTSTKATKRSKNRYISPTLSSSTTS